MPKKKPARAVKQAKKGSELTPKQQTFIAEYLANGFNATKAAAAAGYSAKTAESQGCRLLKNVKVAKALAAKAKARLEKRDISAERVLDEIAKIAFHDHRKLYNPYGSLIAVHEMGDDEAAAIAGFEMTEISTGRGSRKRLIGSLKKVKMADRLRALELLGRHQKLFTDRVEHGGDKEFLLTVKSILNPERKHGGK